MTFTQIPVRAAFLVWREVDDGTVVVTPKAGEIRVLNQVGTTIWEMSDGRHTVADIEAKLIKTY